MTMCPLIGRANNDRHILTALVFELLKLTMFRIVTVYTFLNVFLKEDNLSKKKTAIEGKQGMKRKSTNFVLLFYIYKPT